MITGRAEEDKFVSVPNDAVEKAGFFHLCVLNPLLLRPIDSFGWARLPIEYIGLARLLEGVEYMGRPIYSTAH